MDDASRKGVAGGYRVDNGAAQDAAPAAERPVFTIRLRPEPGVDGVKALRAVLKSLLHRHGLRCLEAHEAER
jgi:hypothetical protein